MAAVTDYGVIEVTASVGKTLRVQKQNLLGEIKVGNFFDGKQEGEIEFPAPYCAPLAVTKGSNGGRHAA